MKKQEKETNDTKRYTDSFWNGWFSVFQPLYGLPLELPDIGRGSERDHVALAADWQHIGADLRQAIGRFTDER